LATYDQCLKSFGGETIRDFVDILWPHDSVDRIASVFKAYFDESWDQQQKKILVIGGMMGRYEEWSKIEWPWKELLEKYEIAYYRASEAEFARGEFNKEPYRTGENASTAEQLELLRKVREDFFEVVTRGVVSGLAIGIPVEAFREVANTSERLEKFGGTPYYLPALPRFWTISHCARRQIKYHSPQRMRR
jgi:hypothetical protein